MPKRVTLNIQNKSAKYILTELEKESKIGFVLKEDKAISELANLSINVNNVSVEEVLATLFKNTNYTYQIIDNIITIQRKEQPLKQGRKIVVKGKVVDAETQAGIAGATLLVKGTTVGAISDEEGKFSFSANIGQVVEVVYIGMKTYETTIAQTNELIITLVKDIINVDDVVVTGIFNRRAGSFTGSALSLKSEDLDMQTNPA